MKLTWRSYLAASLIAIFTAPVALAAFNSYEYPLSSISASTATITVETPDGESIVATYDLSTLR